MERLGRGRGGGTDEAGEEMEKLEVPAEATELLCSLAWLIPGGLPLPPCTCLGCVQRGPSRKRGANARSTLSEGPAAGTRTDHRVGRS